MEKKASKWKVRFWVLFGIFCVLLVYGGVAILQLNLAYSVAEDAMGQKFEKLSELNDVIQSSGKSIREVGEALSDLKIELYDSDSNLITLDSINQADSDKLINAEANFDRNLKY